MNDTAIQKEPATEAKPRQAITPEPLISLYVHFGLSKEERSQQGHPNRRRNQQPKKQEQQEIPFMEWRERLHYEGMKREGNRKKNPKNGKSHFYKRRRKGKTGSRVLKMNWR